MSYVHILLSAGVVPILWGVKHTTALGIIPTKRSSSVSVHQSLGGMW
jgi:hypothetical protein